MNPYKFLVWEYSSNNERWFDATDMVEWIKEGENSFIVRFKEKANITHVSFKNIEFYDDPKQINYLVIEHKGVPQFKVKQCLQFGDKYKIFLKVGTH